MAMACDLCGKTISLGNKIARRGKAKYLGGVGKKITGITRRKYKPNLQHVRMVKDGKTCRGRVCTQCIRSGRVQKPIVSKPFTVRSA